MTAAPAETWRGIAAEQEEEISGKLSPQNHAVFLKVA